MPTAKGNSRKKKILKNQQEFKKKYQEIEKFVDFKVNTKKTIPAGTQKKIQKYWAGIRELSRSRHAGYKVYRPRKKENLKKAQNFAHGDINLPGLKVAFVPVNGDGKNTRIKFNKDSMIVIEGNISRSFIAFNKRAFLNDPKTHARKQLEKNPAKNYQIAAGAHFIKQSWRSINQTVNQIEKLTQQYSDPENNHFFGNWMVGVYGYNFHDQKDLKAYKKKRANNRQAKTGRVIYNETVAIKNVKKKVKKNLKRK